MTDEPTLRIVALHGSPRKGTTWGLLERIADELEPQGIGVELIHLGDYTIKDCVSCHTCLNRGFCPIKDDHDELMNLLQAADGIILASPVYMAGISAQLKRFIDRAFIKAHRPTLAGKPLLAVSTAAGAYTKMINKYLHQAGQLWGMYNAGSIGRVTQSLNKPLPKHTLDRFVRILRDGTRKHRPSLGQIGLFHGMKDLASSSVPLDAQYWQDHGLQNALYYYPCHLGWKRPISWLLHQMMLLIARRLPEPSRDGSQSRVENN